MIDLAGGKQPIFNETGEIAIVFNGEIYNYIELRQRLIQRGHRFTTSGDTEVIVHLYEEFGSSCLFICGGCLPLQSGIAGMRACLFAVIGWASNRSITFRMMRC